jgi:hypothetical protein
VRAGQFVRPLGRPGHGSPRRRHSPSTAGRPQTGSCSNASPA